MKIRKFIIILLILIVGGFSLVVLSIGILRSQSSTPVEGISGLAVAQSPLRWNKWKDAVVGDNQTDGIGAVAPYLWDGANYDTWRGTAAGGAYMQIVSNPASTCGTAFYAIKRDNITNAASVNLAFGFTSKKVVVETAIQNSAEIIVDWIGGVAVIPAANTAGDDRIAPGRIVVFDDYAVTSISVIANSAANQVVYVRAFN